MDWINDISKQEFDLVRCEYDPVFFITKYCYTLDPKDAKNKIKLIPKWEYVTTLIENIHANQNNLIEKTRQMIVSWITQAYNVWGLLFGNGYAALNLSRKEDLVDDKTHNSLFGKMRFIFDHLPEWMIEARFGKVIHSGEAIRYLRAQNEKYNNSIIGESANIGAGRGGSFTKVFADEFGFVDRSESVYSSFDDACPTGKNLITTPPFKGKKCCFYRLREGSFRKINDFEIVRIHWTQHPHRNKEWYRKACQGKTDDEVARELDIDWNISVKGRIYDRWETSKHIISYKYQNVLPLDLDFDFGIGESPVSIGVSQDLPDGKTVYFSDMEFFGLTADEIMPKLTAQIEKVGYVGKFKELRCWGDPSGKARGATGKSWITEFRRYDIIIQYTTNQQKRDLEYGHLVVNRMIAQDQLVCTENCHITIDSLESYKRKTDTEGNVLDSMLISDDWAKHRADGIRYKAINTRLKKEFDYSKMENLPAGL